jgi:hypothetical protein
MTRDEIAAASAAALARKRESRANEYRTYSRAERLRAELEERELPQSAGLYAREFRGPSSASDFWDDRLLERNRSWWDFPETALLITLADLLREGDHDGARAALKAAKALEPGVQWAVFGQLRLWKANADAPRWDAERAVNGLLAEWQRLKLPETDPAAQSQPRRRRRRWETSETEAAAS